jgi:EmrB/QacA subfamily drug resistance transporter
VSSAAPAPLTQVPRQILLIASLAAFMAFLDTTIVNIAFPALQHAYHDETSSSISWVLNAYNIVFAALLIPAGQLADRYSRRKLFLLGLALFTLASGCCAIAPTLPILVALRMTQAIGAAVLIPTGMALLLPAFPANERIKAIALLAAVSGVAFAAGPSIGGILINTVGWQGIFLINLPLGILTLTMSSRLIKENHMPTVKSGKPDVWGALLILTGVGTLALAIVQGNTWHWTNARTIVALLTATALLTAAVWQTKTRATSSIELGLLKTRRFAAANIAIFAFAIGLAAKLLCDVLFMTTVWHYSELKTGLAVSASPIVTAVLARTAARLAIKTSQRASATLGGTLYAAGCVWYTQRMGTHPHYLTSYLPGTILTGSGIALILPTLTSAAMLSAPEAQLAAGAGINSMIRQLGAVLGIALFIATIGTLTPATTLTHLHHAWALAAIASATAATISFILLTNAPPLAHFSMLRKRTRTRMT